jgi:hypothetical protein
MKKMLKHERERSFIQLLQTEIIPGIKQIRKDSENLDTIILEEHKSNVKKFGAVDEKISRKNNSRLWELEKDIDVTLPIIA